jgi:hypothetical protein
MCVADHELSLTDVIMKSNVTRMHCAVQACDPQATARPVPECVISHSDTPSAYESAVRNLRSAGAESPQVGDGAHHDGRTAHSQENTVHRLRGVGRTGLNHPNPAAVRGHRNGDLPWQKFPAYAPPQPGSAGRRFTVPELHRQRIKRRSQDRCVHRVMRLHTGTKTTYIDRLDC